MKTELEILLKGKFWTNEEEMVEEIEKNNYDVLYINDEYMTVIDIRESDGVEEEYRLIRAGNTIAIDFRPKY